MRIIQVLPYYHPHVGGIESHVLMLSRELKKRGHDVAIYTSRHDPDLPSRGELNGIPIHRVDQLANLFMTPITPGMDDILVHTKADILHCHAPPPLTSYYCAKAKKRLRIPTVMTYHCDLELPVLGGRVIAGIYRRTLGAYTLNRMDRVIVHTETYAATSRALWKYHPTVIPTGVDLERFHPEVDGSAVRERLCPEGQHMVMYVGRLAFHKGIEYFIDASRFIEDTRFVIVGDGPYRKKLEERRLNSPRGFDVVFTGKVPEDDLPGYYAATDILVLPSVSRLEGFGLVMLEAMATGKPIVASNMPGMREVLKHGREGLLAEPLNPKDFAFKIKTLLDNEVMRKKMGENGRNITITKFSWDAIGAQMETLYTDTIEEKRAKG